MTAYNGSERSYSEQQLERARAAIERIAATYERRYGVSREAALRRIADEVEAWAKPLSVELCPNCTGPAHDGITCCEARTCLHQDCARDRVAAARAKRTGVCVLMCSSGVCPVPERCKTP